MRFLLLLLLGCGNGDCPDSLPSGMCSGSAHCQYATQRCQCDYEWYCQDNACPSDTLFPSGPCTAEGAYCRYEFEDTCMCENGRWRCVGGVRMDDLSAPVESD
jgi:hypothetical protein